MRNNKQYYLDLEYGISEVITDAKSVFSSYLDVALKQRDNLLTLSQEEWKNFENELKSPKKSSKALKELMNLEGFEL